MKKQIVAGNLLTVRFEDAGQDFSEWDISNGVIIDSRPFQATIWMGLIVLNETLGVGSMVEIAAESTPLFIRYPLISVKKSKPNKNRILLEKLDKEAQGLICTSVDDVR